MSDEIPYDELSGPEQELRRAAWDKRIAESIEAHDMERALREAGVPWVEADDDGNVIIIGP
jgi:hypothetical protein